MHTKITQSQRPFEARCTYCHGEFLEKVWVTCKCGSTLHSDCYTYNGCSTLGCGGVTSTAEAVGAIVEAQQLRQNTKSNYGLIAIFWLLGSLLLAIMAVLEVSSKGSSLVLAVYTAISLSAAIYFFMGDIE